MTVFESASASTRVLKTLLNHWNWLPVWNWTGCQKL